MTIGDEYFFECITLSSCYYHMSNFYCKGVIKLTEKKEINNFRGCSQKTYDRLYGRPQPLPPPLPLVCLYIKNVRCRINFGTHPNSKKFYIFIISFTLDVFCERALGRHCKTDNKNDKIFWNWLLEILLTLLLARISFYLA